MDGRPLADRGDRRIIAAWELRREGALCAAARVLERARERIKRRVYADADVVSLEAGMAAAQEALERLDHCLNALAEDRPSLADEAWHNLGALFAAAISIGGLSTISESADTRVVVYEQKVRKPARMRAARQASVKRSDGTLRIGDAERQSALEKAILDCVGGDVTHLSSYRDNMRPAVAGVCERLPKKYRLGPWPSESTVRKTIRKLKGPAAARRKNI